MCDISYGGVGADLEVLVPIYISGLGTLNTSNSKKVVVRNFSRTLERHAGKLLAGRSILQCLCTGYTQKNGAVSKVNKKLISHLTRAQLTPSAATTVQVSHALPIVRFSCLMRGRGASFQDGVAAGKGFLCALF